VNYPFFKIDFKRSHASDDPLQLELPKSPSQSTLIGDEEKTAVYSTEEESESEIEGKNHIDNFAKKKVLIHSKCIQKLQIELHQRHLPPWRQIRLNHPPEVQIFQPSSVDRSQFLTSPNKLKMK
jgi:hypothetical protein